MPDGDDEKVRQELERVAHADTTSGRGLIAKTTALRALDRFNQRRRRRKRPPVVAADWHPDPPGSEMRELDAVDPTLTPERRQEWATRLWEDGLIDDEGNWIEEEQP